MRIAGMLALFLSVVMGVLAVTRIETVANTIVASAPSELAVFVNLWPFLILLVVLLAAMALAKLI